MRDEGANVSDDHGGMARVALGLRDCGDIAPLYLLAHGHVPATGLPTLPPALVLAPLRGILDGRIDPGNTMVMLAIAAISDCYGNAESGGFFRAARRALEQAAIREYLLRWQNADGSWNGSPLQTTLMMLGLHAAGATRADAPIQRALSWLDGMKRLVGDRLDVCAMENDVWSTALCAMALAAAGETSEGPILARAYSYLLGAQTRSPMLPENQRKPRAARTGGWPFQRGNSTMPDTDDTGVVLTALAPLARDRAPREIFTAIDDGVRWVRDMQNADGGFPTFAWGLPSKEPGPMFQRDLKAGFDYSARTGVGLPSASP